MLTWNRKDAACSLAASCFSCNASLFDSWPNTTSSQRSSREALGNPFIYLSTHLPVTPYEVNPVIFTGNLPFRIFPARWNMVNLKFDGNVRVPQGWHWRGEGPLDFHEEFQPRSTASGMDILRIWPQQRSRELVGPMKVERTIWDAERDMWSGSGRDAWMTGRNLGKNRKENIHIISTYRFLK